jgi:hypothetical protein
MLEQIWDKSLEELEGLMAMLRVYQMDVASCGCCAVAACGGAKPCRKIPFSDEILVS